ncbi:Arc family DNA-binding protein [Pseudomonas lundensis]|uniref:Arc family DNA-binding protein n=1 Tax=Pseudomonas TaxID=286 RepID=UPI0014744031|nr:MULTISPECIES: Arc family DNA-binding protein [Pseudomonas]MBS5840540.1 Arc family DNA-binding protein [Pseudomonas sp.]NNA14968.1 Arc family DNA-binding protein [Pseudomonas lundensis]
MNDFRVQDKFVIRLPDGLRPEIAAVASRNHRSMNGEIIHRLERSLSLERVLDQKNRVIAQLLSRINELEAKQ